MEEDDHSPEKRRRKLVEESMAEVDDERIHAEQRAEDLLERIDSERRFTKQEIMPGGWAPMYGAKLGYYGDQIPWVADPGMRYRDSRARVLIWLVFALMMVVVGVTVVGLILLQ